MTKETISIPMISMRAEVKPETLNIENRSVEVVFSTGARVLRGFFLQYFEELGLEPSQVRLGRLNNGAPFLNNHSSRELEDVIGVVESATVDGKIGKAVVRFSDRETVEPIFQDVKNGILRNISVGYRVHKMEKIGEENEVPVLRATDWEPIEISAVPAGADDGAMFRSLDGSKNNCTIVGLEKRDEKVQDEITDKIEENKPIERSDELSQDQGNSGGQNMDKEKEIELKREVAQAEKTRIKEIRFAVRAAGLGDELADKFVDEDKTIDEVRTEIINVLASKNKEKETRSVNVEITVDERETRKAGMQEALLHRYSPKYQITDNGKQYRYMSLLDMARAVLEAQGVRTVGLSKMQIAEKAIAMRGMHSASDFPEILANVANKTLRDAYMAAPQTFMPFTRRTSAPDFKEISRTQLGDAPNLEELPENGEIKRGTIGENAEKYSVKDYAKIIAISRKTIVNDDLGAFTRVPELMGRAARDLESDLVWGVINANAALSDGNALFSAPHGNVGTPGAISDTTLGELRKLMRQQVGLNGRLINLTPNWLWVPTALETAGEKQLAAVQPQETSKVNPFGPSGRTPLQLIVEPRLDTSAGGLDTRYYMSADTGQIDILELATLEGEDGPVIESREGFDVLGMEISVRHTVGAKAIDYRGLTKNEGA